VLQGGCPGCDGCWADALPGAPVATHSSESQAGRHTRKGGFSMKQSEGGGRGMIGARSCELAEQITIHKIEYYASLSQVLIRT
jgi:hypothetical protein